MAQITVRLPDQLRRDLARAARRMRRRPSEVVRMALRAYLEIQVDTNSPADRVRELIGSVHTGIPDLAEKHRDYILRSLRRGR